MALRQGLEALSQGLLRQADIGGRAYEDAARKEAERRAESRQMAAERRALTAQEEAERRQDTRTIQAEGRQQTTWQNRFDAEVAAQQDAADKLYERQKEDAKLLATSKAQKDKIDRLMERAKTEAKTFETLSAAYAKSDDEEHRLRLESELLLSVDRMEAAYQQAGLPKLAIEENLNDIKYRLIVPQVVFNVNSNTPRTELQTVYKAFRDNDPESDVYKNALETLDRYVQEAIDKGMVPEYRSKTRTKTELTKRVVDYMSKNYAKELTETPDTVDKGNGEIASARITEVFSGDPAYQAGMGFGKIIGEVIESFKNMDDMATQIQGAAIGDRISQWEDDEGLKPEEVITRIKERVSNAPERERRVWQIFLDRLDPNQGAMLESPRRINPRGGMIFEADQMNMAPTAVNARYA